MVMNGAIRIGGNEKGMALVAVLLILMAVALMGIGLSSDTSLNVRIAGFRKFKLVSFGSAESSLYATTDVLEDNIDDGGWAANDNPYPYTSADFTGTLGSSIDVTTGDFYMNTGAVEYTGVINSTVTVSKEDSLLGEGQAIQMAAGYEGVGKGAGGGGVHIIYSMLGTGQGTSTITTTLGLDYRHVTK